MSSARTALRMARSIAKSASKNANQTVKTKNAKRKSNKIMRYHTKNRKQSNSLFLNALRFGASPAICIPRSTHKKWMEKNYNFPVIAFFSSTCVCVSVNVCVCVPRCVHVLECCKALVALLFFIWAHFLLQFRIL